MNFQADQAVSGIAGDFQNIQSALDLRTKENNRVYSMY